MPVLQAARWEILLLMAHGDQDRRVPVAQGEAFRDALRQAGKLDNRFNFARRMAGFLGRHLAP